MTPHRGALPAPVGRLLVSHALASLGMSLPWPLLLVLVWERGGDGPGTDLLVGLTGAARMLPYVVLSWATGRLADRYRRDRLVRCTVLLRVGLLALSGVAVATDALLVAVLTASLAVACGTPAYPALAAAMPSVAGPARRRATDLLVTIEVASFVVGPAVGGLLLGAPRALVPVVAVGLSALALVPLAGVRLPHPGPTAPGTTPVAGSAWSSMRASGTATRAVVLAGLLNAVDAALVLALLPLSTEAWRGGARGYGLAAAMVGFGALAAPALWRLGRTTGGRARFGLVLVGVALAVVPLAPTVGWALAPLVVVGAATVHVEGALTEAIQDAVPDHHRAGMLGLTDSVMVGAALLASLAAPWLSSTLGAALTVVLLAACCTAAAGLPLESRRAVPTGLSRPAAPGPSVPSQRRPARPPARSSSGAAPPG